MPRKGSTLPSSDWSQRCSAMSLSDLRSTVSDGCTALPRISESEDLGDRLAGLMVIVAVSELYRRLEKAGDHNGALAVLAEFTGTDWPVPL